MRKQNKITKQFISENGNTSVEVKFENEDIWLNSRDIASLYAIDKTSVNRCIKNILDSTELVKDDVSTIFTNTINGRMYVEQYYNLDMIIKLGYRFNPDATEKFVNWIQEEEEVGVNMNFSYAN